MIDYFALLGEDRRPWIDADLLKKRFLALSGEAHPDRVHGGSSEERLSAQHHYAELNAAYNSLRHPKERLQHLLELETGAKPQQVQQIPADLTEFFFEVGRLFQQVDKFLAEKAKTSSPLLLVQLFEAGQLWTEKLNALQQRLRMRQQDSTENLKALDRQWAAQEKGDTAARRNVLQELERLYRLFGYYARWEAQIQERIVQLSL